MNKSFVIFPFSVVLLNQLTLWYFPSPFLWNTFGMIFLNHRPDVCLLFPSHLLKHFWRLLLFESSKWDSKITTHFLRGKMRTCSGIKFLSIRWNMTFIGFYLFGSVMLFRAIDTLQRSYDLYDLSQCSFDNIDDSQTCNFL